MVSKSLKFGLKWQFLYFKPILSVILVTIATGKSKKMPEFYTWAILLINQKDEIGNKQLSVFGSREGQNSPLMHVPLSSYFLIKVSKAAKIRKRYNQVPHLTQDTNGKVTNSQLDTTNENQEVSPFQAGDHKAHINRCAQRHSKHKTEQKHKRSAKEVPP